MPRACDWGGGGDTYPASRARALTGAAEEAAATLATVVATQRVVPVDALTRIPAQRREHSTLTTRVDPVRFAIWETDPIRRAVGAISVAVGSTVSAWLAAHTTASLWLEVICRAWRAATTRPVACVPGAALADTVLRCSASGPWHLFSPLAAFCAGFARVAALADELPGGASSACLGQAVPGRPLHAREALA